MNLLKQLVLARMLPQPLSARPDASSAWSKSRNKVKGRGELDHPKKAALFFKFSELAADIITEIIDGQVLPAIAGAKVPYYAASRAKLTASLSARAKLRPRLLVASGRLIPSPEIQVSTGKDLLIPRGRAGLEASYRKLLATRFYARPAAYPIGLEASYLSPISPGTLKARKGDLVLYSGDLLPTEARKLPSCPRSHSVNRKGKPTHPSAPLVDAVRFYEASKHSSLALINQEFCRHSLRLPVVSYTSCIVSHASYPPFLR
ncbi:hypothetical protein MRB53_036252 [Persea americana]|nr:hypothetical protein MRB53_036643 [Persea americana]KAJ8614839.1 hypothetical protein MRB53_036252 [Persea americana]